MHPCPEDGGLGLGRALLRLGFQRLGQAPLGGAAARPHTHTAFMPQVNTQVQATIQLDREAATQQAAAAAPAQEVSMLDMSRVSERYAGAGRRRCGRSAGSTCGQQAYGAQQAPGLQPAAARSASKRAF